ncbi:MAG: hypothetical protein ACPGQL_04790 [Thermoplasmatota archaeon]
MNRTLALLAVAALLSGCASEDEPEPEPSSTTASFPADFALNQTEWPPNVMMLEEDTELWTGISQVFNATSNPGSIDTSRVRNGGAQPEGAFITAYRPLDNNSSAIFSMTLQFGSEGDMQAWLFATEWCSDPEENVQLAGTGQTLIITDATSDDESLREQARDVHMALSNKVAASPAC